MWIFFAFLTAICEAAKDAVCKKSLHNVDEYVVAWSWKAFPLPFLLPLLFFVDWPTELSLRFWAALFAGGLLNVLVTFIYIRAIRVSDLSLTVPLLSFTPVFLLGTSPLLVGEVPAPTGYLGVMLIFLGSYVLGVKNREQGYLGPLKALLRHKGPRLMLLVAALWSVAANMDKIGVLETSPFFWAFCIQAFVALGMTPVAMLKSPNFLGMIRKNTLILSVIGFFAGMGLACQMTAIEVGLVPYVISIKRTSIVFSVLFGGLIFREQEAGSRLLGALIMVLGIFCITLL